MVDAGFITEAQRDEARQARIRIIERPNFERTMGYAFDLAVEEARAAVGREVPDLVIQMTINNEVQAAASDSIRRRLGNRAFGRRPLQASYMAVDRQGGICRTLGRIEAIAGVFVEHFANLPKERLRDFLMCEPRREIVAAAVSTRRCPSS